MDEAEIRQRLGRMAEEHRDLDAAIEALSGVTGTDQVQLMRLKKRKLLLRDEMVILGDMLLPDIIA